MTLKQRLTGGWRRWASLPRSTKQRIFALLAVGAALAVAATQFESHLVQLALVIVAECFGVCAAQLIRNATGRPPALEPLKPEPVWHADALRNHFNIEELDLIRLGIDRTGYETFIRHSEWYRRAAGKLQ